MDGEEEFNGALAYATGSGSVRVDTSEEGEKTRDTETVKVQRVAMRLMAKRKRRGITSIDLLQIPGVKPNLVSTALTNLHIDNEIVRLKARRDKAYIYVLPEFVGDREINPYMPQAVRLKTEEALRLAENMAEFLMDRGAKSKRPSLKANPGDKELAEALKQIVYQSRRGLKKVRRAAK